jgi:Cu/Ag efflux protein CusF
MMADIRSNSKVHQVITKGNAVRVVTVVKKHVARVTNASAQGADGPTGPTGPEGPQGPQGDPGTGSGDVVGPASAVDDNLASFNTTTGKLIQDSGLAVSDVSSAVANDHTHSNKSELDLVTDGDHDVRTDNPHSTTKAHVGLGNADNTSDADKPISTATQTALDLKSDTGHNHTASDVTDFDTEVGNHTDVAANTAARHSHANKAILDATTASFLVADETKLDGIEDGAQVNVVDSVHGRTGDVVGTNTDYTGVADWQAVSLHLDHTVGTGLTAGIINFSSIVNTWMRFNPTLSDFEFTHGVRFHDDIMMNSAQENGSSFLRFALNDGPYLKWDVAATEFELSHPFKVVSIGASGSVVTITDKAIFEGDVRGEDFYINHLGTQQAARIYFGSVSDPQAASLIYDQDDDFFSTLQGLTAQWLRSNIGELYIDSSYTTNKDPLIRFTHDIGGGQVDHGLLYSTANDRFELDGALFVKSHIDFEPLTTPPTRADGRLFYNQTNRSLDFFPPGTEVTHNIGHELLGTVPNNSGVDILNGEVFTLTPAGSVEKAIASDGTSAIGVGGMATELIEDGTTGLGTVIGSVGGLNTIAWPVNTVLYLSDTVAGGLTDTPPESPSYVVRIGIVIYSHVSDGMIYVHINPNVGNEQGLDKFYNGSLLEESVINITSNGTIVTLELDSDAGDPTLSLIFEEGLESFIVPDTVALTPGTDAAPALNYVFIPEGTSALTSNTTGFPTTEEYVPIATVFCQSATSVLADDVLKHHSWIDHIGRDDGNGHLSDLNFWIRNQHATWLTGAAPTVTDGANLYFDVTSGTALQLHINPFNELSMTGGHPVYIVNDPVTTYKRVTNLNTIVDDSAGGTLVNKYFKLVFMGICNSDGESQVLVNLPSGSYLSASGATADIDLHADFSLPMEFKGTGFLIASVVLRLQGGVYTAEPLVDLRGTIIGTVAGGVGGGAAGSEFQDSLFRVYNVSDPTKEVALDVSGVTTGTTRSLTVPDEDGTIALNLSTASFETSGTHLVTHDVLSSRALHKSEIDIAPATGGEIITGFEVDATVTLGAGGFHIVTVDGFKHALTIVDNGTLFSGVAICPISSVVDAGGAAVSTAVPPVNITFSNPEAAQQFTNGYARINVTGGASGTTVALFTATTVSGSADGIGYKGFATATGAATGELVGVQGFSVIGGTGQNIAIGLDGQTTLGGGDTERIMGLRTDAHALIREGAMIVTGDVANKSPEDVTTDHLDFTTTDPDAYVEGKLEVDGELFADGNESHSLVETEVTPWAAGTETCIMIDASGGNKNITLPTISTLSGNRAYHIMKVDSSSNTVTITPKSPNLVNGAATLVLTSQWEWAKIVKGTQWFAFQ